MHLFGKLSAVLIVIYTIFGNIVFAADSHLPHQPTSSISRRTAFPEVQEAKKWRARDWDSDTWVGFEGRPWFNGDGKGMMLIRHKRYVVNYDTNLLDPRWTAHIDTKESVEASEHRPNSSPDWKRPSKFTPDPFLKKMVEVLHFPLVVHDDFNNTGYSRGHMTPNAEMKGFDQQSQVESFYLSNIAPQLQNHNGGVWAQLESDCMGWAREFGTLYVITGGIYPESDRKLMKGVKKIAVPESLYKVVIYHKDGKVHATGFLIPHKNGFKKSDVMKFQVPVDKIEDASGIDFMPLLGEPNDAEVGIDGSFK